MTNSWANAYLIKQQQLIVRLIQPSALLSQRFSSKSGPATRLSREQRNFVSIISKKLHDGSYRMRSDPCPCGQSGSDIMLAEVDRYGLPLKTVLCSACGTLRTNPYPDDDSLADFYTHYYQQMYARSDDHLAYFRKQQAYGKRVLDSVKGWLAAGSLIFEAGCGAGGALDVLRRNNYQVSGCDYSRELVDFGRSRGLALKWGPPLAALNDAPAPALVYMHHVFEHVRDPLAQLRGLRDLLAPEGKLLIIVPDVSRISEHPLPAGDLRLFLHIAHRFNFSMHGFCLLAAQAGFSVESLQQREAHGSPEFWALLSKDFSATGKTEEPHAAQNMLDYLQRTERRRRWLLNRGQFVKFPTLVRGRFMTLLSHARQLLISIAK